MTWWSLVLVVLLGCPERPKPPAEREKPAVAKHVARVDAAIAKSRFEIVLEEVAVDRPIYPVPRGFRPREDAVTIGADVERAFQREIGRVAACVNEPKSAAIQVWWKIAPAGRALDVSARATITSPGQDPARDSCIADVIRSIVFYPPGRVVPIELGLWVRTDD